MNWTYINGHWVPDDHVTAGPPHNLPANNPKTNKPWKNNDRFDDTPAAPRAPFAPGWKENEYVIQHTNQASFSIIIDSHQKKHTPSWPGNYSGAAGTTFPKDWTRDDVIAYAQALVPHCQALQTTPATNQTLTNIALAVEYTPPKKSKVKSVIINSASWDATHRFWAFHFYPG
ncbi:hypothetical protein [Cystobacter fuscus]|uniref:hypothetical protein n=1 Tax=Cystobacter fuscus TaxID=43 RepID=UPI002B2DEB80|nr:hypothetical protein F0U63_19540 [Cystobacter fuscus]